MKGTLSFQREIAEITEEMKDLQFMEGDYYDIYHHMVMDKGFESDTERIHRFAGFRLTTIGRDEVTLDRIAPPTDNQQIKLNETVTLDFEKYGTYKITLKEISA